MTAFFGFVVIYNKDIETKENKFEPRIKLSNNIYIKHEVRSY